MYTLWGGGGKRTLRVYDVMHVPGQLLGMCHGGEGGGEEMLVSCSQVGSFGAREGCEGRRWGGGALRHGGQTGPGFLCWVSTNLPPPTRKAMGGKGTGLPRRG